RTSAALLPYHARTHGPDASGRAPVRPPTSPILTPSRRAIAHHLRAAHVFGLSQEHESPLRESHDFSEGEVNPGLCRGSPEPASLDWKGRARGYPEPVPAGTNLVSAITGGAKGGGAAARYLRCN